MLDLAEIMDEAKAEEVERQVAEEFALQARVPDKPKTRHLDSDAQWEFSTYLRRV